jgi:hypothetical protein
LVAGGWIAGVKPAHGANPRLLPRPDRRCLTGLVICVDKQTHTLRLVRDGRTELTLAVRFGAGAHPTRDGTFHIFAKDRHHVSSLYPGLQMPYSLFFSGGEAVHYSPVFAEQRRGHSHGCVETLDEAGTRKLFEATKVGDPVVVYRGPERRPSPAPPAPSAIPTDTPTPMPSSSPTRTPGLLGPPTDAPAPTGPS